MTQSPSLPGKLAVDRVALARGERAIVSGVSFEAAAGEALMLVGPNGIGKTTLLRAIAGFLAPSSGSIRLDAGDPQASIGERCHFIGHADAVKGKLTVRENVAFWQRYMGGGLDAAADARTDQALDRVGLIDFPHVPAAYLSAGQKRRIGLARLLVAERPLWLLDEPLVSLDDEAAAVLLGMIEAHLAADGIALVSTHRTMAIAQQRTLPLDQFAGSRAAGPA